MKKILFKLGVGLRRHAPTILAGLGCIGVVATAIVSGKAALKAEQLLREAEEIKGCELTKKEAIVSQIPAYIVPMVTAGVTIAFIFGCNALNKKQQASLAAAAVSIEEAFRRYQSKVVELSADMDKAVKDAIAEEAVQNADAPAYGRELFYDSLTNEYFESTTVDVQNAEYQANYLLQHQLGVSLSQWRGLLGLPYREEFDDIGWSGVEAVETGNVCWIDFLPHESKIRSDGVPYKILSTGLSPIFDYENYESWERAKLYPSELTALEEFNLMQKKGAVA